MTLFSYLTCGVLVVAAVSGGAGTTGQLPSGNNAIAGPAFLEGAAGSKTIIFSNFSGENQQYGITIINQGKLSVTLKDSGQLGGSNFSATIEPGTSFGAHVSLNNTSSIQVGFDKSEENSERGKLLWRVDIIPRKK